MVHYWPIIIHVIVNWGFLGRALCRELLTLLQQGSHLALPQLKHATEVMSNWASSDCATKTAAEQGTYKHEQREAWEKLLISTCTAHAFKGGCALAKCERKLVNNWANELNGVLHVTEWLHLERDHLHCFSSCLLRTRERGFGGEKIDTLFHVLSFITLCSKQCIPVAGWSTWKASNINLVYSLPYEQQQPPRLIREPVEQEGRSACRMIPC